MVGVLDVREVFTRVSEVVGRVLEHDAIALPVITDDRQHAIPFATAGPDAAAYPGQHPIPAPLRYLLVDPWEQGAERIDPRLQQASLTPGQQASEGTIPET